jgi:hypothetical protein
VALDLDTEVTQPVDDLLGGDTELARELMNA